MQNMQIKDKCKYCTDKTKQSNEQTKDAENGKNRFAKNNRICER